MDNLSYKKIFFLLILIAAEISLGLWCTLLPLYYLVAFTFFIILSVFFLVKIKMGVYFLILIIIIFGNYIGLSINVQDATMRNLIPLYAPIYFSIVTAFISQRVVKKEDRLTSRNFLNIPIFILFFYSIFTILFSFTGYRILVWFLLMLNISIFYFVIKVIDNEAFHHRLMWYWAIAGNVLGSLVVISILFRPKITYIFKISDWLDFVVNYAPHVHIRGYAIGHPNQTSLLLNLASCVIFGMFIYETHMPIKVGTRENENPKRRFSDEKNRFRKKILLFSFTLCIFANFLTQSKAGVGSFWAMIHFIILFSSPLRRHLVRNIIIFNLAFVILFFITTSFSRQVSPRILKVSERGGYATSASSRIAIWRKGLTALGEKSLIPFGLGVGGYDLYTDFPHPHSLYLSFFFDFGIIGILCIVLIVMLLFNEFFLKELKGILFYQKTYFDTLSVAFLGGLIAIAIHGIVDHSYIKGILWLFLGFAISTLGHSRLERGWR